jgi:oligoribonuclease
MRRWRPEVLASAPEKLSSHRAMEDVLASVAELRHYRAALFGTPTSGGGS